MVFSHFDTDGDGFITAKEFARVLNVFGSIGSNAMTPSQIEIAVILNQI